MSTPSDDVIYAAAELSAYLAGLFVGRPELTEAIELRAHEWLGLKLEHRQLAIALREWEQCKVRRGSYAAHAAEFGS